MTEPIQFQGSLRRSRKKKRRGRQLKPPRTVQIENRYSARLFGYIDIVTREITELLIPRLDEIVQEQAQDAVVVEPVRLDDAADKIQRIFGKVTVNASQMINLPVLRRAAERTGRETSDENGRQSTENVEAVLGVKVFPNEPWLETEMDHFVHENASLIQGMTDEQIKDIEQSVFRDVRSGAGPRQIQENIAAIINVTKNRAKVIARDQVNKFNGRLSELRQKSLGITEYTWRTSDDERVRGRPSGRYPNARPSHWLMEGVKCRWDDSTVYHNGKAWVARLQSMPQLHPGQPINDRCIAEPIFPE